MKWSLDRLFKKFQIFTPILVLIIVLAIPGFSFAQTETPTETPTPTSTVTSTPTPGQSNTQAKEDLQKQISELQGKITELKSQQNSLSSQIKIIDSQTALTELKIKDAQAEIESLKEDIGITQDKILSSEGDLEKTSQAFIGRAEAVYKQGGIDPWQVILASNSLDNFFTRLKYLKVVQLFDKKQIYAAEQAKVNYQQQQDILEDKKKEEEALNQKLKNYTDQLSKDKEAKKTLLSQTQGSEANYQKLLSQAQAQLSALSSFARSATGGVSIIPHEELSDSWGKYYNQRDANWGNNLIGSSSENISSVGCLLTSYAMVVTHFGGATTPPEVAANSGNFWYSTALFLKPGPSANGHSVTSTGTNPQLSELRDALNSGKGIIAGLSYDGGPIADHWVVLRSVDGDSFKINDPLYQGAMNVSLNDHYSGLKIVEARIYH